MESTENVVNFFVLHIEIFSYYGFFRFIDSVTPTLSSLHPLSVINKLALSCMDRVEASNVLKRDQYLSQLQGGGSKRSTAERGSSTKAGGQQPHCVIEQCIATQIQATIILPKVRS